MATKNPYERLLRDFNDASPFEQRFNADVVFTVEGTVPVFDKGVFYASAPPHILGPLTIQRPVDTVAYRAVWLSARSLDRINEDLKSNFITSCRKAGALLPRSVVERFGIPFDVTPELRWLGLVVEVLRNHGLGYVKRSKYEAESPADSYCYDAVDRPFLASAKAIEEAGLVDSSLKKRLRKRKRKTKDIPPTPKQIEAFSMVLECKGNKAEAARRLGLDRKTVDQHYKVALVKSGTAVAKVVTKAMPSDSRGQDMVAAKDDGPASIGPKPRVMRDRRLD